MSLLPEERSRLADRPCGPGDPLSRAEDAARRRAPPRCTRDHVRAPRPGRGRGPIRPGVVEWMPPSKDAWLALRRLEDLALVHAMVGRQDEAIEVLGRVLSGSGEMTPHVLRLDPCWDPLRRKPKFEALLAKYEVKP